MNKHTVQVWLEDDKVYVSCNYGEIEVSEVTNSWLWLLGAIAFPTENKIIINDERKHRQEHQRDISCKVDYPDFVGIVNGDDK